MKTKSTKSMSSKTTKAKTTKKVTKKATKKYELGGMTGMDWPWKPKKKYASDNARKRQGKRPKCAGNQCV